MFGRTTSQCLDIYNPGEASLAIPQPKISSLWVAQSPAYLTSENGIDNCQTLATIDLTHVDHQLLGSHVQQFLSNIQFDLAYQTFMGKDYAEHPVEDAGFYRSDSMTHLSALQQLALTFFVKSEYLSESEIIKLFNADLNLLNALIEKNMIVVNEIDGQTLYRLNDLTLLSKKLPNDQVMYLFADAPKQNVVCNTARRGMVSETSYHLLNYLEHDYKNGKKYSGKGADMGSGMGIQNIALLMLYPQISTMYAAEIDEHAMNLNRLNALVNQVGDRVTVFDNMPDQALAKTLQGQLLDFVVSNPPFNAVPEKFSSYFTDFGDGGNLGLDITRLFFDQVLPLMKEDAPVILYSVLTMDAQNNYHAAALLGKDFPQANEVNFIAMSDSFKMDIKNYAEVLTKYLQSHDYPRQGRLLHFGEVDSTLLAEVEVGLTQAGIAQLQSVIWVVSKGARGETGLTITNDSIHYPKAYLPDESPKGGVYIQMHQVQPLRDGVYEK